MLQRKSRRPKGLSQVRELWPESKGKGFWLVSISLAETRMQKKHQSEKQRTCDRAPVSTCSREEVGDEEAVEPCIEGTSPALPPRPFTVVIFFRKILTRRSSLQQSPSHNYNLHRLKIVSKIKRRSVQKWCLEEKLFVERFYLRRRHDKAAREQVSADFIECKRGSLAGEFKREAVRERAP